MLLSTHRLKLPPRLQGVQLCAVVRALGGDEPCTEGDAVGGATLRAATAAGQGAAGVSVLGESENIADLCHCHM